MKVNLDVGLVGQQKHKNLKRPVKRFIRSLAHLENILEMRSLATNLKKEVIKLAGAYPEGALDYFYMNIESIIEQCSAKLNANRSQMPGIIEDTIELPPEQPKVAKEKIVKPQIQRKSLFDEPVETVDSPLPKPTPKPTNKVKPPTNEELVSFFRSQSPREGNQK